MPTLHDAIRTLNPAIVTIRGDVAYDKDEQIVQYDMAQAQTKLVELQAAEEQAKQEAIAHKESAIAKLAAIGLTETEIKALVG